MSTISSKRFADTGRKAEAVKVVQGHIPGLGQVVSGRGQAEKTSKMSEAKEDWLEIETENKRSEVKIRVSQAEGSQCEK